jgi:hypothetical protein
MGEEMIIIKWLIAVTLGILVFIVGKHTWDYVHGK